MSLTINELELLSLDVLGNDPEAAAEYSLLLREFLESSARLIGETLGVADVEAFAETVMEAIDREEDCDGVRN